MNLDLYDIVVTLFAVVISITIHEFAHAASAVAAGDDTPRHQGRISLNPLDHFDPVGFTMIVVMVLYGFGIGWGKPVQVNPYNFRRPRWDDIRVSAWGPLSNVILAVTAALALRLFGPALGSGLSGLLATLVFVNLGLALFNLIPLPPLDGSHILAGLLPVEQARKYARFTAQWGLAALMLLVLTGGIGILLGPPLRVIGRLLLG